ncbi:MAG: ribosomal RNA small subunit methyltransferase A [Chloroflexi bacterium]|nr:ribosomal RNA small subunit methyltransferase A [Chloroflexota bacterium]
MGRLLRRHGLAPIRRRGQHFLVDRAVHGRILRAAQLSKEDLVLEVGPGLGSMTRALARRCRHVVAVELDAGLARLARERLAGEPNVEIVEGDILAADVRALLATHGLKAQGDGPLFDYKVVANLPYAISSPVLRLFLAGDIRPRSLVVMVQEEVARRAVATPPTMSYLSVLVQFYGQPRLVSVVPPEAFYPPPRVSSAILHIAVRAQVAVETGDEGRFLDFVMAGFARPRKQIHNSLAEGLKVSATDVGRALEAAGIAPTRRAATLGMDEWAALARAFLVRAVEG